MGSYRIPTVGVEEEYQLVSPGSGVLAPRGQAVVKQSGSGLGSSVQHELHLEQVEVASPVLRTMAEVHDCLADARRELARVALENNVALVAAGTNPMFLPPHVVITPKQRYVEMEREYQELARDLLIFGCHVHVDMPQRALGVQVLNHVRPWLPVLQALSVNSPFWNGHDTGYASYRREMWNQWPMSDVPPFFEDLEDHESCMADLQSTGAIQDETKIYWDLRLSRELGTIEFRVYDVQTELDDCVALVAIVRALVMRCERAVSENERPPRTRHEILRAAMWRAARYGLSEKLINAWENSQEPAWQQVQRLMNYIQPALAELDDEQPVSEYLDRLKTKGTPAERQRASHRRSGFNLKAVIDELIDRTAPVRHREAQPLNRLAYPARKQYEEFSPVVREWTSHWS